VVPIEHQEEAMSIPGIDLGQGAMRMVLDAVDLGLEFDAATMARNTATYAASNRVTLTTTARRTQSASTPQADVDVAKEAVRRFIGRYPNTMVMGPNAFNALKRHAAVREQFKYTGRDSVTAEMLAAFFDVKTVVCGKAVFLPDAALSTAQATDVWGDDLILAYVPEGDNFMVPAYGYTYELLGYPMVETPYYERHNDW